MNNSSSNKLEDQVTPENVTTSPDAMSVPELTSATSGAEKSELNLDVILDVPVTLTIEIGRTRLSIGELLKLNQGSVVELDRLVGEPHDVLVNGTLIAHGEVVVIDDRFGIRFTDIVSPSDRVKKLK